MSIETFKNPPITEAVFDIRVQLPKGVGLDTVIKVQEPIAVDCPKKKDRFNLQGQLEFGLQKKPALTNSSHQIDGYFFLSEDEKNLVQSRLDGFTFNKLFPYSDWEDFSSKAMEMWGHYLSIVKPEYVTRIALRYVNRIELPLPFQNFKEYILTVPEVAEGLPQELSGFFLRLLIPNKEIGATAIVVETLDMNHVKRLIGALNDAGFVTRLMGSRSDDL